MALSAALAVIVLSLAGGYYIYRTRGDAGADATYDAFAVASSVAWLLTGAFLILGGWYLFGGAMIVLFSWIALTKGQKTRERLRARIAN